MKKVMAIILSLSLVMGLSTVAFAESPITTAPGTDTQTVDVTVDKSSVGTVYSVNVEWDSMDFTYEFGAGTWNPSDHSISGGTAGWQDGRTTANIKVTNHSNAAVGVAAKFGAENSATTNGVTATLPNNTFDLAAGKLNDYAGAANNTATVTIDGTPDVEDAFTVGTVTVTVSAK